MSLRIFHVVFIVVCLALSVYVGVWGVSRFMATKDMGALTLAIVFLIGGVALVEYGRRTFRKLRELD